MTKKRRRRRLPRRWPMIRLSDTLAALMPKERKLCDVVIFRMYGIGDALLMRVVLEKYAEALNVPMDEITIFGSTLWTAAANMFFRDVEVLAIDERRFARKFFYRLRIMRSLRRRGFLTAICCMRYGYPQVVESLMLASGAPRRITVEPRPNEKFDAIFAHYRKLMTRVISLPEPDKPRAADGQPLPLTHEIEHQLAFLSAIAGKTITLNAPPKLTLAAKPPPLLRPGERYAVINIGASYAPRCWPLANFLEIGRRLVEQGITAVILGGPFEERLKPELEAFKVQSATARLIFSVNEFDFGTAAQLVNQASLVVSNDTGIGHLAIMLDRPSVLLVGGGHYGSFMPYPKHLTPAKVRFLSHLMPCFHCNWNCTMMQPGEKTFPCVDRIAVDDVWRAVGEISQVQ